MLMLVMVAPQVNKSLADFANYYFGAALFSEGVQIDVLYEPIEFNLLISERNEERLFSNFAVLPPTTIVAFLPVVGLDAFNAKWLFVLISVALFAMTLLRLLRHLQLDIRWSWLVVVLAYVPLTSNGYQGQFYLLLFVILVEGWLAYLAKRFWLSATLWSLAAVLKIFPLALGLLLLVRRDVQQISRWGMVIAAMLVATIPVLGIESWQSYLSGPFLDVLTGHFSDPFAVSFQSPSVLLRNLMLHDAVLNPEALIHWTSLMNSIDVLIKVCALWWTWKFINRTSDPLLQFACLLLVLISFSGYGTVYALILLVPLLVVLIKQPFTNHLPLLLLLLIYWLPMNPIKSDLLLLQFSRMWLQLALFLVLIKPWTFKLSWKPVGLLVAIAVLAYFKPMKVPPAKLLPNPEKHLLTYEFYLENDELIGLAYGRDGIVKRTLLTGVREFEKVPIDSAAFVSIRASALINGDTLVVLADWGRGHGFYDAWIISNWKKDEI